MRMDLKDKVIVVTGAAKGLGRALAEEAKKEGARVVLCDISPETDAVARSLGAVGVAADVRDEVQVRGVAEAAVSQFGRIDVWINNAGLWTPYTPSDEIGVERVRDLMDVNFFGVFNGCRAAIRQMKEQGSGIIVNVLSIRAKEPRAKTAAYSASKFAADGFSKVIRDELRPVGIAVVTVYPGGMRTAAFGETRPANYAELMDPAEVAGEILNNLKQEKPLEELVMKRTDTVHAS